MEQPATVFDENILYEPENFKRWASYQDCLMKRYRERARSSIISGDTLLSTLNTRSGKISFHGRAAKWPHTRDFWAPLGTVDTVLSHAANRSISCDREELLNWIRDQPPVLRAWVGPGPTDRGDYEQTGARCFQILRITLESGEYGYFYRPNFTSDAWQQFLNEDLQEKIRRRNEAETGEWARDFR